MKLATISEAKGILDEIISRCVVGYSMFLSDRRHFRLNETGLVDDSRDAGLQIGCRPDHSSTCI